MKKMRLSRKYKIISKGNILVIILIILILGIVITFSFISKSVMPKLLNYAEFEMRKFASLIINKTVIKEINDTISIEDLLIMSKDNSDNIHTIDFNPIAVNRLLSIITDSIQTDFKAIESGNYDAIELLDNVLVDYDKDALKRGIVFMIPSGIIFDNPLLSNLGPKIPVRFTLSGEIVSSINTTIENYGINNALVEVSANVKIVMRVILPIISKDIEFNVSIPIIIKLIEGTVPNYYFNGIDKDSNILTVPSL